MRILVLLITLLEALPGVAQVWCPPGATWVYNTSDPFISSVERYQYVGDTTVGGFQSQRIGVDGAITYLWGADTLILTSGVDIITRSASDIVYCWAQSSETWDTLYWFGAVPGDSWRPRWAWAFGPPCPDNCRWQVLDTGSVSMGGISLRTLTVQGTDGSELIGPVETIMERVGNTSGYFEALPICGGVFECLCTLTCYGDEDVQYPFPGGSCSLPTTIGIPEKPMPVQALTVWPNPGTNALHLDMAGRRLLALELRDALGRTVLERTSLLNNNPIDVSSLAPGTYVVLASTVQGERLVATWVKQ